MAWNEPRTWLAGELVTPDLLNEQVRDNLKAIGDAWTPFTPVLAGSWTLGDGTLEGWCVEAGRLVIGKVRLTLGSTTTVSGRFGITLPWTHANAAVPGGGPADGLPVGVAAAYDASAASSRYRYVVVNRSTLRVVDADGAAVGATTPFRWAEGDVLSASFTLETAP